MDSKVQTREPDGRRVGRLVEYRISSTFLITFHIGRPQPLARRTQRVRGNGPLKLLTLRGWKDVSALQHQDGYRKNI